jgi:C-terminal processing protease CtpA/Prc
MERKANIPRKIRVRGSAAIASLLMAASSFALELPAGPFANLKSEDFKTREAAQEDLLKWARERREQAMDEFFLQSRRADDPEVRERCLAVLRELVIEDYLKEGEGYIGIRMRDEFANVPDDPRARGVIRVIEVVPDSAAEEAGLELNDLIVSLDGKVWHQEPASAAFGDLVRKMKPGHKVKLDVLRDGKIINVEVKLGRRPLIADSMFFNDPETDVEALEKNLKDDYFKRWLDLKKSGN